MPLRLGSGPWLHEMVQSTGSIGLHELSCQYRHFPYISKVHCPVFIFAPDKNVTTASD